MFGNKDPQPKPVSHYANTNPSAGPNPTSVHATNPYPSGPSKVSFVPPKNTEKNKTITLFLLAVTTILFAGLFVWKYIDWASLNNKIEMVVDDRIAEAELAFDGKVEAKYEEYKNSTRTEFTSSDEFGSLSFSYPKNWSLFVASDNTITGNNDGYPLEIYMNPNGVGPMTDSSVLALRVYILNERYEDYVARYNTETEKGDYIHNTMSINNENNTADIYTSVLSNGFKVKRVIFKLRGQTAIIRTDSVDNFGTEFDKIINSITFKD